MRSFFISCLYLNLIIIVFSKEVFYDLKVSYFYGAPDGVPKSILGFNEQFPGPTIRAEKGDILTVKITNLIQDHQTTTIHWHGFEQYLTPFHDGARLLTQCDIPYNSSYTYSFEATTSGTYWYHSHHTMQYGEGLWGIIIIDNTPEVHEYDGEFLLAFSDWFHPSARDMSAWYKNNSLSKGGLPFPDSSLVNGEGFYPCEYANRQNMSCNPSYEQRYKVLEVERGKTYRFRIANPATNVLYAFTIDGHKLETIETDGVDTIRVPGVDISTISTGTRFSFLVTMDGELDQYWIRAIAGLRLININNPNINPFPEVHRNNPTVLAVLKYKDTPSRSASPASRRLLNPKAVQGRPEKHDPQKLDTMRQMGSFNYLKHVHERASAEKVNGLQFYDDPLDLPYATAPFPTTNQTDLVTGEWLNYRNCHPIGDETAPTYVNQSIILYIPDTDDPENTALKLGFNNITYDLSSLDKPGLIKLLNEEALPSSLNPITINGFGEDYVVELIINDYGDSGHPFHLHGHTFWVMGYGAFNDGPFVEERDRPKLMSGIRKETIAVEYDSWLVIRFRADNPGLWLFHCHMNSHFEAALGLVFVEGADIARELFKDVPLQTIELCRKAGMEIEEIPNTTATATIFSYSVYLFGLLANFYLFLK